MHQHKHTCSCCGCHAQTHQVKKSFIRTYGWVMISFILLAVGLIGQHSGWGLFSTNIFCFGWYLLAYLPVGIPVAIETWEALREGSYFNEFGLMTLASIGAFYIGEYPEGVAVMLFYTIGEIFQEHAVRKARTNIAALMDGRPQQVTRLEGDKRDLIAAENARPGDILELKAGESVSLDGELIDEAASCNTAALTGESLPRTIYAGEPLLAGMLVLDRVVRMRVTKPYTESTLAKIIELVEKASERKAPTELMIRKLARIYTPVVTLFALLIVLLPGLYALIQPDFAFNFDTWLYRGLVFLVISCPCALVISIPLGYFGGIGAASKAGILLKGGNYLDLLNRIGTFVFDKTGTLTEGSFSVSRILPADGISEQTLLARVARLEQYSNHPIAQALVKEAGQRGCQWEALQHINEVAGMGLEAECNGEQRLAGNLRLLNHYHITYPDSLNALTDSVVVYAEGGKYQGALVLSDRLKTDTVTAVSRLQQAGYEVHLLSGDRHSQVQTVAQVLHIEHAYGDLLPQDKVSHIEHLRTARQTPVAFVGDGINDAPVLALSHLGIAMGGLGSDVAIEAADMVIQNDRLSSILTALHIAKDTRKVVWQNIVLALGLKIVILFLGLLGFANLWMAVFADVGVALLAILNAVRIQSKKR